MLLGTAPCECGNQLETQLTGENYPSAENGTWWTLVPNQKCPFCGLPLIRLHEPNPDSLKFSLDLITIKNDHAEIFEL